MLCYNSKWFRSKKSQKGKKEKVGETNDLNIQNRSTNGNKTDTSMTHNENANKLSNRIIAEICDFGLYKDEQLISYLKSKYEQVMNHPKIANNSKVKSKFKSVFQDICQEFQVNWDSLNVD